jgi:sugar lactone lactonase YvrE
MKMKRVRTSLFFAVVLGGVALCGSAWGIESIEQIQGLISYWKFDEGSGTTAYDSAGSNDGTTSGDSKMYWTDDDAGRIQRANLDGSSIENIITGVEQPRGIAIDIADGKMYWCEVGDSPHLVGMVRRANLDGTDIETLVSGLHVPSGIALGADEYRMYWIDYGAIYRANMDGSDIEVILYGAVARDIALDMESGKIYWTCITNQQGGVGHRSIRRSNLDGTGEETIVGGLGTPDGIALDLEYGKMYWTDQYTHKVQRANLDGTDVEDLVVTGLDRPYGIALDFVNSKMYWVDWGTDKIQRANLDGTDIEDLVTSGLVQPLYIALVTEPLLPISIDIKPRSCPNPVNVKSKGVLPVAILGAEDFDVNVIDVASIRLAGVAPIRSSYEDVATPVSDANECECSIEGPDGFPDLTLKFETQMIVEAIGEVNNGDELTLELTGVLSDETSIEGSDCIIICGNHKPLNKADFNGDGIVDMADFAAFSENWLQSSIVEY